jgi:ABC-type multidrug transport system fused ATPase/permease subunit
VIFLKGLFAGVFIGLATGLTNLIFGIALYYGVYLNRLDSEKYKGSILMSAFVCMITAATNIGNALPYLQDFFGAKVAAFKVYRIIDQKSKIDIFEKSGSKIKDLEGSIEFEKVSFSYPQREESKILNGLSLSIPAGKTVALVGAR